MIENLLRARNHLADFRERFQRRAVLRVHGQIPRTQLFQFQLALAFVLDFADDGHDFLFHRVVKFHAILRRVIEPAHLAEHEIAIIFEARVLRDLRAQLNQLRRKFPRTSPRPASGVWRPVPTPPAATRGPVLRDNGPSARAFFPRREKSPSARRSVFDIAGTVLPPRFPA